MYISSLRKSDTLTRRAIALLVLFCVLLASAPIPIGWKPRIPTGSEPFPCQNCHCGCVTPEQCWTNCCCFSPEKRREWAAENGVKPPSYAVLTSSVGKFASKPASAAMQTCCNGDSSVERCHVVCESNQQSCCSQKNMASTECSVLDAKQSSTNVSEQSDTIVLLSVFAAKCHGGSSEFTLLPWAIIEDCQVSCASPEPVIAPFKVQDEWLPSSSAQPDPPPPRASRVA